MNQISVALAVGLLAGVAGGIGVHLLTDGRVTKGGGEAMPVDLGGVHARLERIEAALAGRPMTSEPILRGSAAPGSATAGDLDARFEALATRIEDRLKPLVAETVQTSMKAAFAENEASVMSELTATAKREMTLAEAAAELELTAEQEEAVRRIAGETTEQFFQLLAGKDGNVEDVKREFEDAKRDPKLKSALGAKYMTKALGNIGELITLGLEHDRKMKEALGPEKASKLESDFKVTDLDPYALEDMFDFG